MDMTDLMYVFLVIWLLGIIGLAITVVTIGNHRIHGDDNEES
jgi:hypothetical protein